MANFKYYSPTNIIFGQNEEKNVGSIIKNYGYKHILMVYGKSSIFKSGLYDTVTLSLKEAGISWVELGGVEANPKIELCREGVEIAKREKIEMILAVGGGSVVDTAKSIGVGALVDFDTFKFTTHEEDPKACLPIGVILTLSAAGSELSNSCVISDTSIPFKNGFNSDLVRPLFAIEDPALTNSVSPFQTGCGVVDITMHTIERYLTDVKPLELVDEFAEGLMRTVMAYGNIAMNNPTDYDARANLMLASSFSHNGLTGMSGKMYFTVHKLEHQLSAAFDCVAHGAGLSVLFPAWAAYVCPKCPTRFAKWARRCMGVTLDDDTLAGLEGIKRLKEYFKGLPMPTSLSELKIDIKDSDIEAIANRITKNDTVTVAGIVNLNKADVIAIYNLAK